MSNKKLIQALLLGLALLLVAAGAFITTVQNWLGIAGLSLVAAVCIWYGIDYYAAKKKTLGVLMIAAALAIVYMVWTGFVAPLLELA